MKAWWLSWYHPPTLGPFELHSPWWISGCRLQDEADTIVAAVQADDEPAAWTAIFAAYDTPPDYLERRFIDLIPDGQPPFSDRFPQADWMTWPDDPPT